MKGKLLDDPDLPLIDFLSKIYSAITSFSEPVPHHTHSVPSRPLTRALLNSEFVFFHEDASSLPLSQQYQGPYQDIDMDNKYFKLQIGSKHDNITVDWLKPVFTDQKVFPALSQLLGKPPPPDLKPLPPPLPPRPFELKKKNLF